jgi:hypothetical protein
MKNYKLFVITAFLVHCCTCSFSQKTLDNATATINLYYDPTIKAIKQTTPRKLDLIKNKTYVIVINDVNSALFSVKHQPTFTSKVPSVPSILGGVVNIASKAPTSSHFMAVSSMPFDNNGGYAAFETKLIGRLKRDFQYITKLIENADVLSEKLKSDWKKDLSSDVNDVIKNLKPEYTGIDNLTSNNIQQCTQYVIDDFVNNFALYQNIVGKETLTGSMLDNLIVYGNHQSFINENKPKILRSAFILNSIASAKYTITSSPIVISGDYTTLNISLKKNNFDGTYDSVSQQIQCYNKHYIKVDFSTGLFLNNLVNPTYHYTDTTGRYGKDNKSKFDLSVGALIHVKYAFASFFKVAPSAGIAVSILDAKTKYLMGVSSIFGRKSEVALTVGTICASLSKPSAITNLGYKPKDLSSPVPTYNKLQWGFFFGISYSLINN